MNQRVCRMLGISEEGVTRIREKYWMQVEIVKIKML
jgi:hypothetical protein